MHQNQGTLPAAGPTHADDEHIIGPNLRSREKETQHSVVKSAVRVLAEQGLSDRG